MLHTWKQLGFLPIKGLHFHREKDKKNRLQEYSLEFPCSFILLLQTHGSHHLSLSSISPLTHKPTTAICCISENLSSNKPESVRSKGTCKKRKLSREPRSLSSRVLFGVNRTLSQD